MKVIYIAGPFRAPNMWLIAENVRAAERWAFEVAKRGFAPLCPHTNTAHFHSALPDSFFLEATAELLRRCDGAVFIPGWLSSMGCQDEKRICTARNIPVCDLDGVFVDGPNAALERWLERYDRWGVER